MLTNEYPHAAPRYMRWGLAPRPSTVRCATSTGGPPVACEWHVVNATDVDKGEMILTANTLVVVLPSMEEGPRVGNLTVDVTMGTV
jgi:hypothetical protein